MTVNRPQAEADSSTMLTPWCECARMTHRLGTPSSGRRYWDVQVTSKPLGTGRPPEESVPAERPKSKLKHRRIAPEGDALVPPKVSPLVLRTDGRALLPIATPLGTDATPTRYETIQTNETEHDAFHRAFALGPKGGTFIGLGSTQNYTMFALAESHRLKLYDANYQQLELHQMFGVIFPQANSPGALAGAFAPEVRERNAAVLASKSEALAALYRENAEPLYRELTRMMPPTGSETFMNRSALFRRIKRAFVEGRVDLRYGDHAAQKALSRLATEVADRGETVDYVYLSNAIEERYGSTSPYLRGGLMSLPRSPGAMVLASRDLTEELGLPPAQVIDCGEVGGASAWFSWHLSAAPIESFVAAFDRPLPIPAYVSEAVRAETGVLKPLLAIYAGALHAKSYLRWMFRQIDPR